MKKIIPLVVLILFIALVAGCSPREASHDFTVSFVTYGGTSIPSYIGTVVEEEPIPEKEGFVFEGWYADEDFSLKKVNFPFVIQGNTTLYAKYIDLSLGNEGISYVLNDDKDGYIASSFAGDSYAVVIPPEVKGLPVVATSNNFLRVGNIVEKIYFSPNLQALNFDTRYLRNLSEFVLTGESEYYAVYDGVLYSADKQAILAYPIAKKNADKEFETTFILPDSVKIIKKNSFKNSVNLKKIVLNSGVQNIEESFETLSALEEFDIGTGGRFVTDKGVLYDITDGKVLLSYPAHSAHKDYRLPSDVTAVFENAFRRSTIETIGLNKGLKQFGIQTELYYLKSIAVEDGSVDFYDEGGVLYSSDDTLLLYPSAKIDRDFAVKSGTKIIDSYAFFGASNLHTISFPSSVTTLRPYAVCCSDKTALESITFDNGSLLSKFDDAVFGNDVLITVTFATRTPPDADVDYLLSVAKEIRVPNNVVDAYRVVWRGASDIVVPYDYNLPEYTVTFDSDGGEPVADRTCATLATEILIEREGYSFGGWYIGAQKVTFPYAVTEDVVLRAEWNYLG